MEYEVTRESDGVRVGWKRGDEEHSLRFRLPSIDEFEDVDAVRRFRGMAYTQTETWRTIADERARREREKLPLAITNEEYEALLAGVPDRDGDAKVRDRFQRVGRNETINLVEGFTINDETQAISPDSLRKDLLTLKSATLWGAVNEARKALFEFEDDTP